MQKILSFPVRTGNSQSLRTKKPATCGPPTALPPEATESMPPYSAQAGATPKKRLVWPLPGVLCAPGARRRPGALGAGPTGRARPGRPPRCAWVGWDAWVRSWGAAVQTASSLFLYIVNTCTHTHTGPLAQPACRYMKGGVAGGFLGPGGPNWSGNHPGLGLRRTFLDH